MVLLALPGTPVADRAGLSQQQLSGPGGQDVPTALNLRLYCVLSLARRQPSVTVTARMVFAVQCPGLCCKGLAEQLPPWRWHRMARGDGARPAGCFGSKGREMCCSLLCTPCSAPNPPFLTALQAQSHPKASWSSALKVGMKQCCDIQTAAWRISGLFCISQILFSRGSQSMLQIVGDLSFYCPFQACKCCLPAPQKQSCAQGSCLASVCTHSAAEAGRGFI